MNTDSASLAGQHRELRCTAIKRVVVQSDRCPFQLTLGMHTLTGSRARLLYLLECRWAAAASACANTSLIGTLHSAARALQSSYSG
eukprot:COSAG03_NODE_63_length_15223_cov_32.095940_13_plen_86_part_00